MSFRPTIVALAVAAILSGLALVLAGGDGAPAGGVTAGIRPLLAPGRLPVDDVDRIALARRGQAPMEFQRGADGGWHQVAPFAHPMDPFSMRQLVQAAAQLGLTGRLAAGEADGALSAGALLIDPPLATIAYRWPAGSLTLRLGRPGIAGRAYLQIEGEPAIAVVDQSLHERVLEMDPKEWRQRRLFERASVDSDSIEMGVDALSTRLVRRGRRWELEAPVRTRADAAAVQELVQAIGRVESGGFIVDEAQDLAQFGLAPPAGWLAVTTALLSQAAGGAVEREPLVERLLIGSRIGGSQDRFAMMDGRPTVFRLRAEALVALFRGAGSVVEPTGSGMNPADVRMIQVVRGREQLRLERDLERWVVPDRGRLEVSRAWVEELLGHLTRLRAPRVEIREWPRAHEVATVTLHGFDLKPRDTVRIGRDPASGEWAMENGDGVLRLFPASLNLRLSGADFGLGGS
jgi:hypothetical protein